MYKGTKRAEYNPAGTDMQGGGGGVWQTPATTKNQQAGRDVRLLDCLEVFPYGKFVLINEDLLKGM